MLTWCLLLLFLDLNPQRTHGSDLKINNLLIKYLTAIYNVSSWESDALHTALGTTIPLDEQQQFNLSTPVSPVVKQKQKN